MSENDGPPSSPAIHNSPPTSPGWQSPPTSPVLQSPPTSPLQCSTASDSSSTSPKWFKKNKSDCQVSRTTFLKRQQRERELKYESSSEEEEAGTDTVHSKQRKPLDQFSADNELTDMTGAASDVSSTSSTSESESGSERDFIYSDNVSLSAGSVASSSEDDCAQSASDFSDDEDPLFDGSEISADEAILKVLQVYIAERWTKKSLDSNVKLIRDLLPKPNLFPSSGSKLLSRLDDLAAYQVIKEHYYCSKCQEKKGQQTDSCLSCVNCEDCKEKDDDVKRNCDCCKTSVFFEFSIEEQLKYMLEYRGLASAIDDYYKNRKTEDGCICDVTDGTEYMKVRSKLEGRYDLVLLTSSDGVELSTSSKQEMWPCLSVPCEVLPNRRPNFMLISGVFVDSKKPKMNTFFRPFVDSLKSIHAKGGISWIHPISKKSIKSQVASPILCADAPAKAILLNVKNHNHRFGCNVCEQKAVRVEVSTEDNNATQQRGRKRKKTRKQKVTLRRFVFTEEEAPLRTGERMFLQGELAERRKKSRKGVIGHSVVCDLPFFDRGLCICAEYLHVVLLGVVKYFLNLMCNVRGPWYIGSNVKHIDQFLKSIKVPDFVKRLPRGLRDLKFFKGSELRAFLLFYSLPALKPYLPSPYFQHWMLLVLSINILLKDCISKNDLNSAEIMLRCFVRDVGKLYHNRYYTYNVHNLLHICTLVQRWGNLWATSAFPFESYNSFIISHVHGTKHLGKELLNNIRIIQSTKILEMSLQGRKMLGKKTVELCGTRLCVNLTDKETEALNQKNIFNFEIFNRIKVKSVVFTSRYYDQCFRRANSFVQFENTDKKVLYGEILHFIRDCEHEEVLALINVFKIKHTALFYLEESLYQARHLLPVEDSGNLTIVHVSNLLVKVIKAGIFLCVRPNPYEINL